MRNQEKITDGKFLEILSKEKELYFVFDYDGTIAPLVIKPKESYIKDEHKKILNDLANCPNTKVAIVTGRSFANLKSLIKNDLDPKILLVGTHGAEIGAESNHRPHERELEEIKKEFINESQIHIEEKPISISVHYKNHPNHQLIYEKLLNIADKYSEIFRVQEGHFVFEYLPKDINKGLAVNHIKKLHRDALVVFFGDDLTDNYAFDRTNHFKGLSIQVEHRIKEYVAKYYVDNSDELYDLLIEFILTKDLKNI